ncbi:hypothetical protein GCM10009676_09210 [Prauserella halophila]|uniref:Uncharacterized protein n=1 Tax=Prauserella halophila TaxID=185641 RepID=A0ABP4GLP2_9PSEU|nr:hypothetical protein [Prauserella halophila]
MARQVTQPDTTGHGSDDERSERLTRVATQPSPSAAELCAPKGTLGALSAPKVPFGAPTHRPEPQMVVARTNDSTWGCDTA